ncbi:uncharacterized protein LOC121859559 isoform X1 [Homarus americanus]|uniref:uncharacterized protein LOC121859559 isoform X1 n=1 Tax=Homarus americanus TaxID=6706 RepID=UPI001C48F2DE|nr:uncharacterized protein LOC121859559 isoform X1 [Homarus americanus]XP_042212412.1 uncharacterized protein LOC121859559 isoform X1 [Homarus americanus]
MDEHFMEDHTTWEVMNFKEENDESGVTRDSEKDEEETHESLDRDEPKMTDHYRRRYLEVSSCFQSDRCDASDRLKKNCQEVNEDHVNYCTDKQGMETIQESICIQPDPELMNLPLQFKHEIDDPELLNNIIDAHPHTEIMVVQPNSTLMDLPSHAMIKVIQLKQEREDTQPYCEALDTKLQENLIHMKSQQVTEESQNNLENKYSRPRRQPKYKCQNCGGEYSHVRTLESHTRICGKIGKLRKTKCIHPSCALEFFHKFRMIEHYERDHSDEGPELKVDPNFINPEYICCNCECVFTNLSLLHTHEKVCGKSVNLKSPCTLDNNKKVLCIHPSCRKKFTHKSILNRHVKKEHPRMKSLLEPLPNYSCQNCLRNFTYMSSFLTHERACGNRSKVRKTPCTHPLCKREFFHKCRLLQHVREEHPDMEYVDPVKDTNFRCPKCDREYSHERSLKSHTQTCGKRGKLRKQQCIHSSCTKEFFHKSRMMQHVKRDHPDMEEPKADNEHGFKCQNCDTLYGHLQSLQRHMEICGVGGKLKKTKCIHPSCEKMFFHISSMMKHMENDHTDMEVNVTEKSFASLTEFKVWKEDEEMKSYSYFSTRHSVTSNDGKAYLCFVCQYNGPDRYSETPSDTSRGSSRKWKKGRVKTGMICPARMLVKECHNGSVTVKYVKTHNHEVNKNNVIYPPPAQRTFRKYHLAMREASKKTEPVATDVIDQTVEIASGEDALGTVEVSVEDDISGEMTATAVGTGYFDNTVRPNCGYVHTLEKASETIQLFQQRTMSRYICYKVQRSFGRDGLCAENRKILWQQEELRENTLPEFDGVPYILNGTKVLECQYGVNRSAYQKKLNSAKRKQESLQREKYPQGHVSKKVDCPAKIFLKDVIKFPDFKVQVDSRQEKKIKSNLLRLALKDGRAQGERRIYIQLPKESDHCAHDMGPLGKLRKPRANRLSLHPLWDTHLNDSSFLHTFRVTKPLFQFLVNEWQKEENERLEATGLTVSEKELLDNQVLAALYYLGSGDNLAAASAKFKVKPSRLLDITVKFADFLLKQNNKYIKWPPVEERVQIAEIIKQDCGFPGVFGAMDASLIHMTPPVGNDKYNYALTIGDSETNCAFVLQFIVDHRLVFRDIHLDSPKTGTRIQVFQESEAWLAIQNLTSAETHLVAPAVYPLAPALMTPHMTEMLSYQEALYNENHQEAHKLTANAMTVFKSRFRRMQKLDNPVETSATLIKAACILHNIALMNESETVLNDLGLEYNSELDEEGWHTMGMEEVVAEIGILGGEEKRLYLTTVMTAR